MSFVLTARTWFVALWLTVGGLAAAMPTHAQTTQPPASPRRYVLVVSIDGVSYNEFVSDHIQAPLLRKLAQQGVLGPLQSVFPSQTWVAHASLSTGQLPAVHGVLGNRVWDRELKQEVDAWQRGNGDAILAPTLYERAKAAGHTTAAVLWPNTSRAVGLDWNLPEVYSQRTFDSGSSPGLLTELDSAGLPATRIGRHGNEEAFLLDTFVRETSVHLIEAHAPELLLTHFVSLDTYAHTYGPRTPETRWALELIDRYVGDLLAAYERKGLTSQLTVLVVSDHGMLPVSKGFSPSHLFAKKLKPRERKALEIVYNGHVMMFYVTDPKQVEALVPKVADLLRAAPDVEQVVLPDGYEALGLPTPGTHPNLPDLLAIARPDVYPWLPKDPRRTPNTKGLHGYPPRHPDLLGLFVAWGQGVKVGERPKGLSLTDIASIAAQLLGFSFEGRAPLRGDVLNPAP
ncbi:MAG: alkaline phosphatase family protein [Myxococcota bacterium]